MMDIERLVEEQIADIDFTNLCSAIVEKIIRKELFDSIEKAVKSKVDTLIYDGIDDVFNKPVMTDDGWGKREQYGCFEDLFKKVLKEKLEGSWEAKRMLEKAIKERTDALVTTEWKRVIQKIVDELTHSKVVNK
jgi:hypothetical protein